jgi:hypothetical protein
MGNWSRINMNRPTQSLKYHLSALRFLYMGLASTHWDLRMYAILQRYKFCNRFHSTNPFSTVSQTGVLRGLWLSTRNGFFIICISDTAKILSFNYSSITTTHETPSIYMIELRDFSVSQHSVESRWIRICRLYAGISSTCYPIRVHAIFVYQSSMNLRFLHSWRPGLEVCLRVGSCAISRYPSEKQIE